MIDLADFDGDGSINFAEFARIMTADNILKLKNTLVADTSAWVQKTRRKPSSLTTTTLRIRTARWLQVDTRSAEHAKLRRTGASLAQLRKAHATYKKLILARYDSFKDAFNAIDADRSGLLRRAELRKFLGSLSKSIPDKVITSLIDFCDSDGDAKTLNMIEFVSMMSAETLGAGGYDPQGAAIRLAAAKAKKA